MPLKGISVKIIALFIALISAISLIFGYGGGDGDPTTTTIASDPTMVTTVESDASVTPETSTTKLPIINSSFEIIFIDVGQADSILVKCDGKSMLVDGGNVADSSLVYSVLEKEGIKHLDYVVGTHAHEDHIGGLAGALTNRSVGKVYCPVTEYNSTAFKNFAKTVESLGNVITIPSAGDSFTLGNARINILAPVKNYDECNDTSIVMKIIYGKTSFLLTGDAGYESEKDIIDAGYDLSATVLKVGHHGSSSSTGYVFLREIMPQYAVISVGKDNSYGHPTEAVLSRLRDANVKLYRTDIQGDIRCVSDGNSVVFTVTRNQGAITNPTSQTSATSPMYIVNKNSGVIHRSTCTMLPNEKNQLYYDTLSEVYSAGFSNKCEHCKP